MDILICNSLAYMITTCAGLRHKELNTSADYVYMFTAALRDAEILCESRPKQILDEFLSC